MSSNNQGRPRRRYNKPSHSRPRDRHVLQDEERLSARPVNTPPPPAAPKEDFYATPPTWFDAYMNNFKKQLISDITQDILRALDASVKTEADVRRYKSGFFAMRSKLHRLEAQQNPEERSLNQDTSDESHRNKNPRSGHKKKSSDSSTSSARLSQNHDNTATKNGNATESVNNANVMMSPKKPRTTVLKNFKDKGVIIESNDNLIDIAELDFNEENPCTSTKHPPSEAGSSEGTLHDNSEKSPPKNSSISLDKMSPGVISSLTEILNLLESKNADSIDTSLNEPTEQKALSRKVRSILNKLTPENFDALIPQIKELDLGAPERQENVVTVVFDGAIKEPLYSVVYAKMCKKIAVVHNCEVKFRELLLSRCEVLLVQYKEKQNLREMKMKNSTECLVDEEASVEQEKSLDFMGLIMFVGELFNQELLSVEFIEQCLQCMVRSENEIDLGYLCHLIKVIGKNFESRDKSLAPYFDQMEELRVADKLSNKMKLTIENLVVLMANGWKEQSAIDNESEETFVDAQ